MKRRRELTDCTARLAKTRSLGEGGVDVVLPVADGAAGVDAARSLIDHGDGGGGDAGDEEASDGSEELLSC